MSAGAEAGHPSNVSNYRHDTIGTHWHFFPFWVPLGLAGLGAATLKTSSASNRTRCANADAGRRLGSRPTAPPFIADAGRRLASVVCVAAAARGARVLDRTAERSTCDGRGLAGTSWALESCGIVALGMCGVPAVQMWLRTCPTDVGAGMRMDMGAYAQTCV